MKYGYKELKGKCKNCLFKCGRVEDINFNGVERCEYYIGGLRIGDDNRRNIENNERVLREYR